MTASRLLFKPPLLRGVLSAAALSLLLAACAGPSPPRPTQGAPQAIPAPSIAARPVTLRVAAVGDIMMGTDYPENRLPPDGGASLLAAVAPVLRGADIAFGNLEGVLADGGEPVKRCSRPEWCYLFRTPTAYVANLTAAGFTVLSLANNHARDFGEEARTSTMQTLDAAGIHHSGRLGDIASWSVKGERVALIAFAPYSGSNNMLDVSTAAEEVRRLKRDHAIVIVSFHGGAEGGEATRLPFAEEFYHGEDRGDVVVFAHAVIDAGADLVLGHGPHVPRALELYRGRLVAYSLGNFCTYQGINIAGTNGLAPILVVDLAADGRFLRGEVVSAQQRRPAGTVLDPNHGAAQLMRALTTADFPQTQLVFDAPARFQPGGTAPATVGAGSVPTQP